jgi:hypothetical protein
MTVISNSIEALAPRDELSPAQTLKLIEQMAGADKPALSTAIGFKEWANVCEALGTGVMSLILRKGGIHEGRSGFEFKHKDFFLFPTWFHTQGEKLTWQAPNPERFVFPPEDGRTSVDIDYFCMVEQVWRVTDWDKVAALAPHHVWAEDVIKERLFTPLGMTSAGFGGTGTPGQEDQPWPHLENGSPLLANGPTVDNPPVMGPAGTVHASLEDWAKFIADHLRGARGEKALLKRESYEMLHRPGLNDYAMGWIAVNRPWAGGIALTHAGSNTMNYCVTWLAPEKGFAAVVWTNRGGQTKAADEVIGALIGAR